MRLRFEARRFTWSVDLVPFDALRTKEPLVKISILEAKLPEFEVNYKGKFVTREKVSPRSSGVKFNQILRIFGRIEEKQE